MTRITNKNAEIGSTIYTYIRPDVCGGKASGLLFNSKKRVSNSVIETKYNEAQPCMKN
jgi:hypothetical protein